MSKSIVNIEIEHIDEILAEIEKAQYLASELKKVIERLNKYKLTFNVKRQ